MDRSLPRAAGIYQIRCLPTGRIYIGSTVNIHARWGCHVRSLRKSQHRNMRLQRAWNKYGADNFEISVVELSTAEQLLEREQFWIEKTFCLKRRYGFNICPQAGSPGATNTKEWPGFIDPDGQAVTIVNLMEFCRRHRLDFPSMHRLAKGRSRLKSYKKWTHVNSVRQRDPIKSYEGFIDPTGHAVTKITNLAAFCRSHNLEKSHMIAMVRGRLCSHKGWTHINGKRRQVKIYEGFVDPDGCSRRIINLARFCRQNHLHPVRMHSLISGSRKSHKGWTWRKTSE